VKVQEAQVSVDTNMKRKWEAAKSEKEKTDALAETSKQALDDLGRIINDAMDDLAQLADEYAHLSLSGSFSAPLEKAIRFWNSNARAWRRKELVRSS
jgi:predicted phage gp36 major capsid-like protein